MFRVPPRGALKQALIKVGHPVQDLAGCVDGAALELALGAPDRSGREAGLRQRFLAEQGYRYTIKARDPAGS